MKEPNEIKNKHLRYTSKAMYVFVFFVFVFSQNIDSDFLHHISVCLHLFGLGFLSVFVILVSLSVSYFFKDFLSREAVSQLYLVWESKN